MCRGGHRLSQGKVVLPLLARTVLFLLLVLGLFSVAETTSAAAYGSKIEAGGTECYTEMVEAGGTLSLVFRVTDGGAFDVNAEMRVRYTPPVGKTTELSRFHYNPHFAGLRDRQREKVLNTWERASEGSYTYTAPSASVTRHGLPEEVTVCFDNSFSMLSPKWVGFSFGKRDVLEVDPDAVNHMESAMEEELHRYGGIFFELAQDGHLLQLVGESDRAKLSSLSKIMAVGLVLNVSVMLIMASYQYFSLSRFLTRNARRRNLVVSSAG